MRHEAALRGPVESLPRRSMWSRLTSAVPPDGATDELSNDFVYRLGELDSGGFAKALGVGQSELWWRSRDASALHRTLDALSRAVENSTADLRPVSSRQQLEEMLVKSVGKAGGAAAGAMIAGVPGVAAGAAIDTLLSRYGTTQSDHRRLVRQLTQYFET